MHGTQPAPKATYFVGETNFFTAVGIFELGEEGDFLNDDEADEGLDGATVKCNDEGGRTGDVTGLGMRDLIVGVSLSSLPNRKVKKNKVYRLAFSLP